MKNEQNFHTLPTESRQHYVRLMFLLSLTVLYSCGIFAPIEQPEDTAGPHFPENNWCSPYKGTMSCDKGICTPDYGRTDCETRVR